MGDCTKPACLARAAAANRFFICILSHVRLFLMHRQDVSQKSHCFCGWLCSCLIFLQIGIMLLSTVTPAKFTLLTSLSKNALAPPNERHCHTVTIILELFRSKFRRSQNGDDQYGSLGPGISSNSFILYLIFGIKLVKLHIFLISSSYLIWLQQRDISAH